MADVNLLCTPLSHDSLMSISTTISIWSHDSDINLSALYCVSSGSECRGTGNIIVRCCKKEVLGAYVPRGCNPQGYANNENQQM